MAAHNSDDDQPASSPFADHSYTFVDGDSGVSDQHESHAASNNRVFSNHSTNSGFLDSSLHQTRFDFDPHASPQSSAMPTPKLNVASPSTSRKPSLRFNLPPTRSPSTKGSPPTSSLPAIPMDPASFALPEMRSDSRHPSSGTFQLAHLHGMQNGVPHHRDEDHTDFHTPRATSPTFAIAEDHEVSFQKPQLPFADSAEVTFESADSDSILGPEPANGHGAQSPPTMQRHRWGTTRNKKGRPQRENVSRSKTLRGIFSQNSVRRSKLTTHPKRKISIRPPRTDDDPQESDSGDDDDEDDEIAAKSADPKDRRAEKRTVVFNRPLPQDEVNPQTGQPLVDYPRNKIRTTKYTPLSFLPKNIFNQFYHNVANIYFLAMLILGAFQIFGVPSPVLAAVPLIVIVLITACKDAIEDSRRTGSDMEINNQYTHILVHAAGNSEYENPNVSQEKVSLWRRFKKLNSKLLFRFIGFVKRNVTKEGRAQKARQEVAEPRHMRKSFDSDIMSDFESPRPSADIRRSMQRTRPSGQYSRRSGHHHREKTLRYARKYWKDVRVGDIVRVQNNEEIPADLVIISTSDDDNCCYVETKNLDGETNLKVRQALKYGSLGSKIQRADDLLLREFQINSEGPQANLYSYQANISYKHPVTSEEATESVTINNLLLRGCFLRNTKWAIGIVAFTGDDTKIMMNAGITPTKQSRLSRELNYYVVLNFILLFILCFTSGIINGFYYRKKNTSRDYFEFGTIAGTPAKNGIVSVFVAVILYQSLVPISLYITIEIIKTLQAFFIYSDVAMYYKKLDHPCTPKSWSISDDLGQIEYIFSDKTGTLTQNLMEFRKCTINGISYGKAYTEALAGLRKRQGIDVDAEGARERQLIEENKQQMLKILSSIHDSPYVDELTFVSKEFAEDITGASGDHQKACNEHFALALALCHNVLVEPREDDPSKMLLKAQSPDEAALVGTARSLGFNFKANTKTGVLVEVQGVTKEYQVLNMLEFNSTRKRMSAIIKIPAEAPDGEPKALLICKGADSIIYSRLSRTQNDKTLLDLTSKHLEEYATEGLRTLCIAQREIPWSQYLAWNVRHQEASASLDKREAKMEAVADSIERELVLLGGTAIEDRLQDGVPDAIETLGRAGIKLWVLTGDKVETAINIGFSCNLLGNDMELLVVKTEMDDDEAAEIGVENSDDPATLVSLLLTRYLQKHFGMSGSFEEKEAAIGDHSPPNEGFGVIIDGDALKVALENDDAKRKFLLLCKQCKAVMCCRVSPAQKAAVVKLVKDTLDVMTLAIGDGSNDVAMIQSADVGVGIVGEEGRQAAMSSDYAVGQFRYLTRLLLAHGRWSYKRFSEMIPLFFYKNVIFSVAMYWYGIYQDFDGTYLFEFTYLMFYNLAFTSLAVIFLGVFDQDVSAKVSLLVPELYRTGIMRTEFTQFKFWWYMVDGIYQSVISFFFPYLMYYQGFVAMNGLSVDHRFWIGIVVTCISCISCNCYILLQQYRWDWLSSLIVAISILIIYTWTGLWTTPIYSAEFYKAGEQMFGLTSFWACSFIGVLVCLIPRFFYDVLQRHFVPQDIDLIRECVRRGDFDAYPESYDPTDPDRPKVSQYSNAQVLRMGSVLNNNYESTVSLKTEQLGSYNNWSSGSGSGSVSDLEQQTKVMQNSTAIPTPPIEANNHRRVSSPTPNNTESVVRRGGNRRSVLDIFKRKSKGVSYYDNNSFIDAYNPLADDLSLRTEEIAMDDMRHYRA